MATVQKPVVSGADPSEEDVKKSGQSVPTNVSQPTDNAININEGTKSQAQSQNRQVVINKQVINNVNVVNALGDDSKDTESHDRQPFTLPESKTNLIINYLPPTMNEGSLATLFSPYGTMENCKIVIDLNTGRSRGYGFVKFRDDSSAARALQALNGLTVNGKTLKVAYARPKCKEIQNANLYITNIPIRITANDLRNLFDSYGTIVECRILADENGRSRGVGFVRMDTHRNAINALNAMDNHMISGDDSPISVKLAQRRLPKRLWKMHNQLLGRRRFNNQLNGNMPNNGGGNRGGGFIGNNRGGNTGGGGPFYNNNGGGGRGYNNNRNYQYNRRRNNNMNQNNNPNDPNNQNSGGSYYQPNDGNNPNIGGGRGGNTNINSGQGNYGNRSNSRQRMYRPRAGGGGGQNNPRNQMSSGGVGNVNPVTGVNQEGLQSANVQPQQQYSGAPRYQQPMIYGRNAYHDYPTGVTSNSSAGNAFGAGVRETQYYATSAAQQQSGAGTTNPVNTNTNTNTNATTTTTSHGQHVLAGQQTTQQQSTQQQSLSSRTNNVNINTTQQQQQQPNVNANGCINAQTQNQRNNRSSTQQQQQQQQSQTQPSTQHPKTFRIAVENLPTNYTVDHLILMYGKYGPIQSVNVKPSTIQNNNAPTVKEGTVCYFYYDDAQRASQETHGKAVGNNKQRLAVRFDPQM